MKANKKYTALEILKEAGVENPEKKIGKMRVRIAGIRGIVKPDHLITIQPATDEIEVVVGNDIYTLETKENEENRLVTEEASKVLKKQGKENTKVFEERKDKKAEK